MLTEKTGVFLRRNNLLIAQRTKVKALLAKNLYGEITSDPSNHWCPFPTLKVITFEQVMHRMSMLFFMSR